ncbi:methionine synthase [Sporomusa sp.]|uniref:methionine synthase n=1 Tax=Sporomusa sp. TaxID=2078658 RepID=UPI002B754D41|nr:methionine synthase [Sporomusa sp.]HWR09647.1 methionine synthase [Sporomusa sp.]
MPIYYPRLTTIDLDETKRYAGLGGKADFSATLLTEACTQAQLLATPKGVWQIYTYDQDSHTIMSPMPLNLTAEGIIRHLAGAAEVAVMAVTIGISLEQEVSNLFSKNQYTLGLLLDAAGTTAVEMTCDAVCYVISGQAARSGLTTGRRFSPGYGGWPVEVQPEILDLASGSAIDLSVTDTKMLVPRKSVTAIIGLYPYHQALGLNHEQVLSCDKCGQPDCQARKETNT